jgi:hypothetical protein
MRVEVVLDRNTSIKSYISLWRKAHLVAKRPIQQTCRNTFISPGKPSMFEAGTAPALFPFQMCYFERNISCKS